MKSIVSKIAIAGIAAICLSQNIQAKPIKPSLTDTNKMSKMSKDKMKADAKMSKDKMKADSKMAKDKMKADDKMKSGKMKKDTGKMSKM